MNIPSHYDIIKKQLLYICTLFTIKLLRRQLVHVFILFSFILLKRQVVHVYTVSICYN